MFANHTYLLRDLYLEHIKNAVRKDTYLFSILWYHAILLYFVVHIVPDLATEGSFCWLLCLFDVPALLHARLHVCFFLSIPLLSGTRRCSRFIFCISWPSPRISYFSKELWVFLLFIGKWY